MNKIDKFLDITMLCIVVFFPLATAKGYLAYFMLLSIFNIFCFARHYRAKMYLYSLQPVVTQFMGIVGFFIK